MVVVMVVMVMMAVVVMVAVMVVVVIMMRSLCYCIISLCLFREWHRLQQWQYHYFSLMAQGGVKQGFTVVGQHFRYIMSE